MAIRSFFVDDSGFYTYLMVDADDGGLKAMEDALKTGGFRVLMSGRSYRPASNGRAYSYYIRVGGPVGSNSPDAAKLADLAGGLKKLGTTDPAGPTPNRPPSSEPVSGDNFAQFLSRVDQRLQAVERGVQTLSSKIDEAARMDRGQQDSVQARSELIEQIRATLAEHLAGSDQAQKLEEQVSQLSQSEHEWFERAEDYERRLKEAELRAVQAEQELKEESYRSQRHATKNQLEDMVRILLSNLEFMNGSLDVLLREFRNPDSALRQLEQLSRTPGDVRGTAVKSASPWKELKCSGRSAREDGRIYYAIGSNKTRVLISVKTEQEADFDRLRAWTKAI